MQAHPQLGATSWRKVLYKNMQESPSRARRKKRNNDSTTFNHHRPNLPPNPFHSQGHMRMAEGRMATSASLMWGLLLSLRYPFVPGVVMVAMGFGTGNLGTIYERIPWDLSPGQLCELWGTQLGDAGGFRQLKQPRAMLRVPCLTGILTQWDPYLMKVQYKQVTKHLWQPLSSRLRT